MIMPGQSASLALFTLSLHLGRSLQMAKVKLNFRRLSVPEKIAKARQIITALTGNASFPNPNPPLETITAGINALDGAYATTQSRKQAVKTAVADQTTKEDALDQLISKCGSYVEIGRAHV